MGVVNITVDFLDYVELYTEVAFAVADNRAKGERVLTISPDSRVSARKFSSYMKKALSILKQNGHILAFSTFSDIVTDTPVASYLLNLFPYLINEVNPNDVGYIVKL